MDQGLIPRRYAKALYEVALKRGDARLLYTRMQQLSSAFANEPRLAATMQNPFATDSDKAALIVTACGGSDSDKTLADFIKLLADNHRMAIVRDIAVAYQDIYRHNNNIYRVSITTAAPLDDAALDRLKRMIQDRLDGGTMELNVTVDPDLIGGFVINIDNQRLDASVKNELKQLRLKLLSK